MESTWNHRLTNPFSATFRSSCSLDSTDYRPRQKHRPECGTCDEAAVIEKMKKRFKNELVSSVAIYIQNHTRNISKSTYKKRLLLITHNKLSDHEMIHRRHQRGMRISQKKLLLSYGKF
jgi:hypothetical protein